MASQEIEDWVKSWEVEPIISDEDVTLIDLKVTMTAPPWVETDKDDTETPDALEVTIGVGAPASLWQGLSESQKEDSRLAARVKVYEEVVLPNWTSTDE